jgi:hypothetical protein
MILLFSGDSKDLRKTVYQKMRGFEMCSFWGARGGDP